ncbi:PLP-dependent transferase [Melanomma pulvis-pyrius CBS 109.77]|uniref:PLP-dependent transferase n=1 Tax=Melanomma pulvis-pyrius CBS 109.77 TaxID=1314802 RepID=A0A6A6WU02_9PLEO|nr:PLP-dependent transferase [Melanomma pulvis-pyrius CBS 109.77]
MPNQVDGSAVLYRNINIEPPTAVKGVGNWVYMSTGHKFFDASCGAAVSCLGHGSIKRIEDAMVDATRAVSYISGLDYITDPVKKLCKFLVDSTHGRMARAALYSSGSEAIEAAMKIARQYVVMVDEPLRVNFIARRQSYHGATLGALGLSGHIGRRSFFESLLNSASHVSPFNPYHGLSENESISQYVQRLADELEAEFQRLGPKTVIAFVAEPVVGAAQGCVPGTKEYFQAMKRICDRHGALLIFDEVMCGMGRTGTLHAWEQMGVVPDIQTIGKGLGAGIMPAAGMLLSHRVTDVLAKNGGSFAHGHTYQNHAVTSAVALEVQRIISDENLLENVRTLGSLLKDLLKNQLEGHPNVGNIRGMGFFWGIEFVKDKATKEPFDTALNISWRLHEMAVAPPYQMYLYPGTGSYDGVKGDHVIVAPPYNISKDELLFMVDRITKAIVAFFAQPEIKPHLKSKL